MAGARGATPCRRERHRARGLGVRQRRQPRLARARQQLERSADDVHTPRAPTGGLPREPARQSRRQHRPPGHGLADRRRATVAIAWTANPSTPVSFTRRSHQHHRSAPAALDSRTARRRETVTRYAQPRLGPLPRRPLHATRQDRTARESTAADPVVGRNQTQSLKVKCRQRGSETSAASSISPEGDNPVDDAR